MRMMRTAAGLLVLVGILLVGCDAPSNETSAQVQPPTPEVPVVASAVPTTEGPSQRVPAAKAALADLSVKGRAPLTDYDREAFGTAWSDTNDNGCDTRNDVLRRDLRDIELAGCVVLSGTLVDPYSGAVIDFKRGPVTSMDVQVDHVVALANAWQTGAKYWTDAQRLRFANDRRSLLAVDGPVNLSKGDADAATWLPPRKAFRCEYVAIQILTKQRYDLWVTSAEKAAMKAVLSKC